MRQALQKTLLPGLLFVEGLFDKPFGARWNPMRQLGTLSFFFYWIVAVSGIYLFVFFDTHVPNAWASIEHMTHAQWYFSGVMRSFHRYASDAMVATTVLHLLREFITDRYRGVRWFTWFTGVPILWFLYVSGISGYWLVWDQLAQYIAVGSMEWIDWLGIFGEPIANNFLTRGSLGDRFFTLLTFMHIFAPLFLLFIMWIHLLKINRPKVNPPVGLAVGCLLMMVGLALAYPALSHPPADLGRVPHVLSLDWFYMFLYPVFDRFGPGALWAAAFGVSLFVAFMPWMPRLKHPAKAVVNLDKCNGCTRCFEDCPFGAVAMAPRTDGRPFEQQAVVDPEYCTGCGLCVGACPPSTPFRKGRLETGIDLVDAFPLDRLRTRMEARLAELPPARSGGEPTVIVFGCDHGVAVEPLEEPGVVSVKLPCVGMLPPSFVDYVITRERADGVMLTGCRDGDCFHRLGIRWTEERLLGDRDPYLRMRVPLDRIGLIWAGPPDLAHMQKRLADFRAHLKTVPSDEEREARRRAAEARGEAAE